MIAAPLPLAKAKLSHGRILLRCCQCGKVFRRWACRVKRNVRVFCSKICECKQRAVEEKRETSRHWKGGKYICNKRVLIYQPDHPRAGGTGYVYQQILVAEKAMGKLLPTKAKVHHINSNSLDDRNGNLVVCNDRAHHNLLHARTRALRDGCKPGITKRCRICKEIKPLLEYHRSKARWDGREVDCRICRSKNRNRGGVPS